MGENEGWMSLLNDQGWEEWEQILLNLRLTFMGIFLIEDNSPN